MSLFLRDTRSLAGGPWKRVRLNRPLRLPGACFGRSGSLAFCRKQAKKQSALSVPCGWRRQTSGRTESPGSARQMGKARGFCACGPLAALKPEKARALFFFRSAFVKRTGQGLRAFCPCPKRAMRTCRCDLTVLHGPGMRHKGGAFCSKFLYNMQNQRLHKSA